MEKDDSFFYLIKVKKRLNEDDFNQLKSILKGKNIPEIEEIIGFATDTGIGSLDRGKEVGKWNFKNLKIEIWFQSQVCIDVDLLKIKKFIFF